MILSRTVVAKAIVAVIGLILGIIIANTPPPEPLTEKSMLGLGIFVFFVMCSMVEVLPDYICWLLMCTSWAGFQCVPFGKAFGAFTGTSVWLVIGAMVLAAAVTKSGLLKRISLVMMTKFPVTYKWQMAALTITGILISPLIPSGTVKGTIMAPFVVSISDSLGLKRKGRGATGLFAAMFMSTGYILPAIISASFINYVILGTMGQGNEVSYMMWIVAALPWLVLTMGTGFLVLILLYRAKPGEISATNVGLVEEKKKLGSMSRDEAITAVVLVCCLLLWMTQLLHHINSAIVILVGVSVLCVTNVVDRQTFRGKVTWDAIIFLGCAVSMTTAFPAMNIDKWIGNVVTPIVGAMLSENILLFIIVFSLIVYAIRFFMTSMTALVALFMVFLVPAANAVGVHPWIMGFITYTAANAFLLKYQHIMYLPATFAAETAAGEPFLEHKKVMPFLFYYMVTNILFLFASVPFWKLLGWV